MLGAGVFTVFGPAAKAAGSWLLLSLVIVAVVAIGNATSSAQLAAQFPESGGAYVYGRERLGHWWGFCAGWSFVIGKTASCAAMALTFAHYAAAERHHETVAIAAVLTMAAANYLGVTRTAAVARVGVGIVLLALAVLVVAAFASPSAGPADSSSKLEPYGVLQAAGLLFFVFAGYARIATMGEEVRDPARTIPRAIMLSLSIALAVYLVVALAVLHVLGPARLADTVAPLAQAAQATEWTEVDIVVRIGAAAGALGALLALMAGIGRTTLAMARHRDLPHWLAAVHPRHRVPHRAELALAAAVIALVLLADVSAAIGFSSFGVLLYYAVANAAALTQQQPHRRYPRALQVIGLGGCLLLAGTLPPTTIGAGLAVLAVGIGYRFLRWRLRSR